MKRNLLTLAVAAAAVAPLSTFAAGPTVYGRLDVTTEYETRNIDVDYLATGTDKFDSNRWLVRSNNSRLGVKGDSQLFGGLTGIYQAEWGLSADTAGTSDFTGRNAFAGIKGDFGTVLMGRKDTPLKEAQGTIDQFNDTIADIQYYFGGEVRADNAIEYISPMLNKAIQFNFMLSEKEQFDKNDSGVDVKDAKNGPANTWSTSITYTEGKNYAAFAYDKEVTTSWETLGAIAKPTVASGTPFTGTAVPMDTFRLVGQTGVDALTFGIMLESSKSSDKVSGEDLKGSGVLLSGAYKLDTRNSLKLQLAQSETKLDTTKNKMTEVALGFDNKLSDTSKLYVLLADQQSKLSDSGASAKGSQMNLGVGIQHNF